MTIKNYSKQCLMISAGIMVLALLLSLFGMGINVGIDFSGGMSMQYTMGEAVTQSDIEGVLNGIGLKDYAVSVQGTGKDSINIRIKAIDDADDRDLLTKRYLEFKSWDTIAAEMFISKRKAYYLHNKALKSLQSDAVSFT